MSKGKEPYLTKTMVGPEDAGNYRCELDTINAGPATIIYYHVTVLPPRAVEEKPPPNIITQEEQEIHVEETAPTPEPELEPEPIPTVAHRPEKKLKSRLLILLILGFVVLVGSIIASVLHFRKTRVKSKHSHVETKSSVTEFKSDPESSLQMGSRKPSQAELQTDSSDKAEEADN